MQLSKVWRANVWLGVYWGKWTQVKLVIVNAKGATDDSDSDGLDLYEDWMYHSEDDDMSEDDEEDDEEDYVNRSKPADDDAGSISMKFHFGHVV